MIIRFPLSPPGLLLLSFWLLMPGVVAQAGDTSQVTQDNVPRQITSFGERDVPVSVGIVFDTGGSMRSVLPRAKSVVKAFLDACNPDDEAFLDTVSNHPQQDAGFTSDFNSLLDRMVFTAGGGTALVDTIYAALLKSRSARHPRKALLVVSGGIKGGPMDRKSTC